MAEDAVTLTLSRTVCRDGTQKNFEGATVSGVLRSGFRARSGFHEELVAVRVGFRVLAIVDS